MRLSLSWPCRIRTGSEKRRRSQHNWRNAPPKRWGLITSTRAGTQNSPRVWKPNDEGDDLRQAVKIILDTLGALCNKHSQRSMDHLPQSWMRLCLGLVVSAGLFAISVTVNGQVPQITDPLDLNVLR